MLFVQLKLKIRIGVWNWTVVVRSSPIVCALSSPPPGRGVNRKLTRGSETFMSRI
jgi:hypothetical protein